MNLHNSKTAVKAVSAFGILYAFAQLIASVFFVFLILAGNTLVFELPNITESEEEKVLDTLPEYDDGFQRVFGARDFTVYGEYYYSNLTDEILEDNEFFQPFSTEFDETVLLKKLVAYYEERITHTRDDSLLGDDLNKYYRFDEITMDSGDWYYLETDRADDCDVVNDDVFELMRQDFDLYYYDVETKTIFLMHDDV